MAGTAKKKTAAKASPDEQALKEVMAQGEKLDQVILAVVALENRLGDGYYPKLEDRFYEAAQGNAFVGIDGLQAESRERLRAAEGGEEPQAATERMKAREDAEGLTEIQKTGNVNPEAGDTGRGDGGDAGNPASAGEKDEEPASPSTGATGATGPTGPTGTAGVSGSTGSERAG